MASNLEYSPASCPLTTIEAHAQDCTDDSVECVLSLVMVTVCLGPLRGFLPGTDCLDENRESAGFGFASVWLEQFG